MIKFFRKIRQQILNDNTPGGQASKFRKYLVYAIGEIVLVVIGILIALSINNWNEQRKINQELNTYLGALKLELKADSTQLVSLLRIWRRDSGKHEEFRKKINGIGENLDSLVYLARYDLNPLIAPLEGLSNTTFQTLVNTGNIDIIPTRLRNQLIAHYRYQEDYSKSLMVFRDLYFTTAVNFNSKYSMNLPYSFIRNSPLENVLWDNVNSLELIKDLNLLGTLRGNYYRNAIRDFEKSLRFNQEILTEYFQD